MRPDLRSAVRAWRQRIIERDGYRCAWCRAKFPRECLTVDHLVPRSQWKPYWGSKHHDSNLAASCYDCGRIKADIWLDGITLSPPPNPRTVRVNWNTARFCLALLRAATPRRAHVPRRLRKR